jgi:hypothetical protein
MSFLLELRTVQTAFYYLLCIGGFFGSILHSIDNTSTLLTYALHCQNSIVGNSRDIEKQV